MTGASTALQVQDRVRAGLEEAAHRLHSEMGIPVPAVDGKLYRPMVAWASGGWTLDDSPGPAFWNGALAIQMIHEASLLHDDILDGSAKRRGAPSLAASRGIGHALVQGDHLLTAAYRAAASTGSLAFVEAFTRAVERTVAGEKKQCLARGSRLHEETYRDIVAGKSGELFGCAALLPATLSTSDQPGDPSLDELRQLGIRVGCLYQMVDDLLDLCPSADLGKPPFQDLAQEKWTWPLAEAGLEDVSGVEPDELVQLLFGTAPDGAAPPIGRVLARLGEEEVSLLESWSRLRPHDTVLPQLVGGWLARTRRVVDAESRRHAGSREAPDPSAEKAVRSRAEELGGPGEWLPYFAHHSKSFRFSARLFPEAEGRVVSGVYAFCRFTDDLVDMAPEDTPLEVLRARLDAWSRLVDAAWEGHETGIPLLDEVMSGTARAGVSARYAQELIRGVAMDLEPTRYERLEDLRRYSWRVASAVGLWLTEHFGTRQPHVLRRAEAMGHAMQLTNILRDVGEDWRRDRLYLPLDRLAEFDIDEEQIGVAVQGGPLPPRWAEFMESLMEDADADYQAAFEAIPALPDFFQRPVAVAGRVYQGIHREIRRNGYDNLRERAYTSLPRKMLLGGGALWALRRERRQFSASALWTARLTRKNVSGVTEMDEIPHSTRKGGISSG